MLPGLYPPVEGAVGAAARGLEGSDATLVVGAAASVGMVKPPPVVALDDGVLDATVEPASGGIANAGGDVVVGELGAADGAGADANCDGAAETGTVVAGGVEPPGKGYPGTAV